VTEPRPPIQPSDQPDPTVGYEEAPLIDPGTAGALSARWDDIQPLFVDAPRDAVADADALVGDTIDHIRAGLEEARTYLEDQWNRGEEVSTEELRRTLRHYRWFLGRLLETS
jgi:hypothetical protein